MPSPALADDNSSIPITDPKVARALREFQIAESYWDYAYRETMIDHSYFVGGALQWDREVRERLTAAKRPALTFNQLQQFVFGVVNEQKQNPSEAQVNAEANGATEDVARVLQDICRRTRTKSHGAPHINAFRDMTIGGIGWWELGTEYVSQKSRKQQIVWKPIEGWSSVYIDPLAEFPTFHNADYGFKFKDISREEFKRLYPKKVATSSWDPFNTSLPGWIGQHHVRVCEHWYAEYTKRELVGLQDGSDKFQDEMGPGDYPLLDSLGNRAQVRIVDFRRVFMEVISAVEVLEPAVEWMTQYIPLIPCMGEKDTVDGHLHIFGMLRPARDPQVASNYMRNHLIEAVGRSAKAQYLMDPAHMEDFEDYYSNANVENRFALPAHLIAPEGTQPFPAPIPINGDTPVQEIQLAINAQDTSLQQAMGSFGPTGEGQKGGVESAEAILARQMPGDRANYRYTDSFNTSLKYACIQTIEMARIVYDVPQVLQLEGLDEKPYKAAVFNSQQQPDVTQVELADGIKGLFDLAHGDFNVDVSIGPSYRDKRSETQKSLAALTATLQQLPDELRIIIPHWIRSMDFPGHDELADQLTPQAIKAQQGDPAAQVQQLTMQAQQKDQQIQHLSAMVQQLTFEKKADQTKALANVHVEKGWMEVEREKNRTANQIQLVKTQADLTKTAAQLSHAGGLAVLNHEIGRIQQDKDHLHEVHMSLFDAANQMAQQQQSDDQQEAA